MVPIPPTAVRGQVNGPPSESPGLKRRVVPSWPLTIGHPVTQAVARDANTLNHLINQIESSRAGNTPLADGSVQYGALPLSFKVLSDDSVSAQLAHSSLVAGLTAGVIGLSLTTAYLFLYYRGLGVVSVSSLLLAGLLLVSHRANSTS